jgi:division protein CdvB (Snf7/Vps24/ESCRT-III family)
MADCADNPARTLAKVTELPPGAPSDGIREETLVQLNGDRLLKTVTWLCQSVQSLQTWQKGCVTGTPAEQNMPVAAAADVQKELLEMRFDSIQKELEVRAKGAALDELKKSLVSKMQNVEAELKSSLTRMNSSKVAESKADSERLHESVEKVSAAVTTQIKLLEETLTQTSGDLSERLRKLEAAAKASAANDLRAEIQAVSEKLAGRISAVEEKAEAFGPLLDNRLSSLRGDIDGELTKVRNRLTDTEKVASDAAAVIADPPPSPEGVKALEQCKELFDRMEEVEARPIPPADVMEWRASVDSRLQSSEARMWRVESSQGQSPGNEARLATPADGTRIQVTEQIHCFKRDFSKQMEDLQLGQKEIRKFVGMQDNSRGNFQPDPLEWLEKRVQTLADKSMKAERTQMLRRINEAESRVQSFAPQLNSLREEFKEMIKEVKVPAGPQLEEALIEEVERLKSIVECLEACAPKETKKAMQFFRKAGGASTRDSYPAELEAQILNIRDEVGKALDIQRTDAERIQNNVSDALRGLERDIEIQSSRVGDLGTVVPRCLDLLHALHAGLGISEQNADCTGGTMDGIPNKPVMKQLEKAIEGIRFPSTWTPTTVRSEQVSAHSTASTEMWSTMRSQSKGGASDKGMRTSQQTQSCGRLPLLTR